MRADNSICEACCQNMKTLQFVPLVSTRGHKVATNKYLQQIMEEQTIFQCVHKRELIIWKKIL